jgi:short subunit dehydrogenase-like uncharacterized protein
VGWMIYGANGYTGELIAREAKRQGKSPTLTGRSEAKIAALGEELQLPTGVFSLTSPAEAAQQLQGISLVLNCAGPFSQTSSVMMQACMAAHAHYLDITGEIAVFESAHRLDAQAKEAGVMLCPGVGFDVVPSDCVALMLKRALPDAMQLALGFDMTAKNMSKGTATSLVESLGRNGMVRRNGPRRIPGWERLAAHRFWPRRTAWDASPLGRCRDRLLYHGHSQHHRLCTRLCGAGGGSALGGRACAIVAGRRGAKMAQIMG